MEEKWITKKELIVPLTSIIAFIILLGGASYAYYSQSVGSATGTANIANANLSVPRGCTFLANATNCSISANTANTINYNDNYISRAELSYDYRNNKIANSSCALNIGVQGTEGCTCSYRVYLYGQTTTNYVANSLTVSVTSTDTNHSASEISVTNLGTYGSSLAVASTGTAVYENLAVTLNAYNVDASQNNQAGINYVYYLRAVPTCSVASTGYTGYLYRNGELDETLLGDNIGTMSDDDYNNAFAFKENPNDLTSHKNAYLKYEVVNDIIVAEYACVKFNSAEFCVNGHYSGYYGSYTGMTSSNVTSVSGATGNIKIISDFKAAETSYPDDMHCGFNSNQSYCNYDGDVQLLASSSGAVNSRSGSWDCFINSNGLSYCEEY